MTDNRVVALTGASGFLGSAVAVALEAEGLVVRRLNRIDKIVAEHRSGKSQDKQNFDIDGIARALDQTGANTLIHLGWGGLPDYSPAVTVENAIVTSSINHAWSISSMEKMIGVGSCLEYGHLKGAITEDMSPLRPNFFGQTKLWLLSQIQELSSVSGKSYCWFRPFWLYGPGQRASSLIPLAIESSRNNHQLVLRSPEAYLDMLHIRDFAKALAVSVLAVESSGIYNAGFSRPVKVSEVSERVFALLSGGKVREFSTAEATSDAAWSSNMRLSSELSWRPEVSLETGLLEMLHEQDLL